MEAQAHRPVQSLMGRPLRNTERIDSWIPAFAGMTAEGKDVFPVVLELCMLNVFNIEECMAR